MQPESEPLVLESEDPEISVDDMNSLQHEYLCQAMNVRNINQLDNGCGEAGDRTSESL